MSQQQEIISREELLKRLRQSLLVKYELKDDIDTTSDIYPEIDDSLEVVFAEKFIENGGLFIYAESFDEINAQLAHLIEEKNWSRIRFTDSKLAKVIQIPEEYIVDPDSCRGEEVSITRCEFLVARTGSIVISTKTTNDRLAFAYCSTHIVIASIRQIVPDLQTCYKKLAAKYKENFPSLISVISGQSRTSDIENNTVLMAQGPSELYVFLLDDRTNE